MEHFTYRHADLACGSASPCAVADVVGTPVSACPETCGVPLGGVSGKTCEDPVTGEEMS